MVKPVMNMVPTHPRTNGVGVQDKELIVKITDFHWNQCDKRQRKDSSMVTFPNRANGIRTMTKSAWNAVQVQLLRRGKSGIEQTRPVWRVKKTSMVKESFANVVKKGSSLQEEVPTIKVDTIGNGWLYRSAVATFAEHRSTEYMFESFMSDATGKFKSVAMEEKFGCPVTGSLFIHGMLALSAVSANSGAALCREGNGDGFLKEMGGEESRGHTLSLNALDANPIDNEIFVNMEKESSLFATGNIQDVEPDSIRPMSYHFGPVLNFEGINLEVVLEDSLVNIKCEFPRPSLVDSLTDKHHDGMSSCPSGMQVEEESGRHRWISNSVAAMELTEEVSTELASEGGDRVQSALAVPSELENRGEDRPRKRGRPRKKNVAVKAVTKVVEKSIAIF
ncbi:hypothetical protein Dimus_006180 [Dionaea muscipula]